MTHGRMGAPDARRFAVYRNNVAVGLIGALEARYPVSRRIAGDDLFRAMARAFVRAHKPRSPVMIAYGGSFRSSWLSILRGENGRPPRVRRTLRVSSPLVGEEQGGGSRPMRASDGASDNLLGPRDPPPLPAPQEGAGALTHRFVSHRCLPTSRGSRTPGSRPIMPKTQPWRPSATSPRSVPIVCPERGSPFTLPRGSCASRRQPPRSGPPPRARSTARADRGSRRRRAHHASGLRRPRARPAAARLTISL